MKRLLLLLTAAMLIASPALGAKTRQLLTGFENYITINATGSASGCLPFGYGTQYVPQNCYFQYSTWLVPRNATITEIEVLVLVNTDTANGDCGLYLATAGIDEIVDTVVSGPHYFNFTGWTDDIWDGATANRQRKTLNVDVTAGQAIFMYFDDWTGVPSVCNADPDWDPVIKLFVWGEWTD